MTGPEARSNQAPSEAQKAPAAAAPHLSSPSARAPSPTHRDHVHEGGLPGVLEPHQRQLHLLLPEQRLEPVQEPVNQRDHLCFRLAPDANRCCNVSAVAVHFSKKKISSPNSAFPDADSRWKRRRHQERDTG